MYRTATVAEIEAYAAKAATRFPHMIVNPNAYGIRVMCPKCGTSRTGDGAERFAVDHDCEAASA